MQRTREWIHKRISGEPTNMRKSLVETRNIVAAAIVGGIVAGMAAREIRRRYPDLMKQLTPMVESTVADLRTRFGPTLRSAATDFRDRVGAEARTYLDEKMPVRRAPATE